MTSDKLIFCKNCGTIIELDNNFCPHCGIKVKNITKDKKTHKVKIGKNIIFAVLFIIVISGFALSINILGNNSWTDNIFEIMQIKLSSNYKELKLYVSNRYEENSGYDESKFRFVNSCIIDEKYSREEILVATNDLKLDFSKAGVRSWKSFKSKGMSEDKIIECLQDYYYTDKEIKEIKELVYSNTNNSTSSNTSVDSKNIDEDNKKIDIETDAKKAYEKYSTSYSNFKKDLIDKGYTNEEIVNARENLGIEFDSSKKSALSDAKQYIQSGIKSESEIRNKLSTNGGSYTTTDIDYAIDQLNGELTSLMVDFAQKAYESSYQTLEDGGVTRRVTNRDSFRQFMKTCYSDEEIDYAISYMGYDFYTNYYNFAYDMIYNSNNVTNEDNIRFWLSEYGATSNEIDSIISSLGKTTATDQTYRDAYILYNDGITNKNDFYLNMHNWGHGDAEIEEAVNALGIILSE